MNEHVHIYVYVRAYLHTNIQYIHTYICIHIYIYFIAYLFVSDVVICLPLHRADLNFSYKLLRALSQGFGQRLEVKMQIQKQ